MLEFLFIAIKGIIILAILIGGFIWQNHLATEYEEYPFEENFLDGLFSDRMIIITYLIFGSIFLLFAGTLMYSIFLAIDPHQTVFSMVINWKAIISLIFLGLIIIFKIYYGPILLTGTLSWTIYIWFQYDKIEILPLYQFIVELLLNWAPMWVQNMYTIAIIITMTIVSTVGDIIN